MESRKINLAVSACLAGLGAIFIALGLLAPEPAFDGLARLYAVDVPQTMRETYRAHAALLWLAAGGVLLLAALVSVRGRRILAAIHGRFVSVDYRRMALAILCGGFLLRLLWALTIQPEPVDDAAYFEACGINWLQSGSFCDPPSAYRPPGTSFLVLAVYALGVGRAGLFIFYAVMGTAVIGLVGLVVRRAVSKEAALWGMLVAALWPSHVAYSSLILSEPPSLLCVLLGLLLLIGLGPQTKRAAFAALLVGGSFALGTAEYFRPTFALFPFVLPWLFRWRGFSWKASGLLAVAVLVLSYLPAEPWRLRNSALVGRHSVANITWVNFAIGYNDRANGAYVMDGLPEPPEEMSYVEREDFYREFALQWIAAHPVQAAVTLPLKKLLHFYFKDTSALSQTMVGLPESARPLVLAMRILNELYYYAFILMGGFAGLVLAVRRSGSRRFTRFLWLWVLYFSAMTVVFFGSSRHHYAIIPCWLAGAGFLLARLGAAAGRNRPRETA